MKLFDPVHQFLISYGKGEWKEALEGLFSAPQTRFESIDKGEPYASAVLNFADSLVSTNALHSFVAGSYLARILEDNMSLYLAYDDCIERLQEETLLMGWMGDFRDQSSPMPDVSDFLKKQYYCLEAERTLRYDPSLPRSALCEFSQNFCQLIEKKIDWVTSIRPLQRPWFPLESTLRQLPPLPSKYPVLLVDCTDFDWKSLQDRPHLLLFPSNTQLVQCLQSTAFMDLLLSDANTSLVLDRYVENLPRLPDSETVILSDDPLISENSDRVISSLQEGDSVQLYDLGKRLTFARLVRRYGAKRYPALWNKYAALDWVDPHKSKPQAPRLLATPPPDHLGQLIADTPPMGPPRASKKKRIAHVMRTVIDNCSAVVETLQTIVQYHDREQFDVFIYTTESGLCHPREYPYEVMASGDSYEWGSDALKSLGATLRINGNRSASYEEIGQLIAHQMHDDDIDIAVFHFRDPPSLLAAKQCDVPYRAYMDHGGELPPPSLIGQELPVWGMPMYACFDLILACEPDRLDARDYFSQLGTRVEYLPIVTDPRDKWSDTPVNPENIMPDAQLITTVSLALEARLSTDFCWAVCEILKENPRAYYCPIGLVRTPKTLLKRFAPYENRVILLEQQSNPSDYLRSMDLYLNEFPFGGGFSVIEAMAAGLPVVCMFDETGPTQARRGGHYLGRDLCITTLDKKDYARQASQILQDEQEASRWKEEVIARYRKQVDAKGYVRKLEALLGA